jgi:RHS repeat-associated protein
MTNAAYADGTSSAYQYDQGIDGVGHLTAMSDPSGATSFTYDQHGRLLQKVQTANANTKNTNPALSMSYSYDASGRMASLTYPSGSQVSMKYDADGRVASLAQGATPLAQNVTYQPFGTAASWTQGNGTAYSRAFDQDGRITSMSMGGTIVNLGYDASSHIVAQTETGLAVKTYGYDALDRLTSFADGASGTNYFYDADGNRTINASTNGNTVYTYALGSNRLLSRSGLTNETDQYDADGSLTNDGLHSFTYDARGRMAQSSVKGAVVRYGINGLGQRISKAGIGVQPSGINLFMYDASGHLLGEYDDKGQPVEETVWLGDLPIAVSNGNSGGGGNGNGGGKGNGNAGGNANANNLFFISPDRLGSPHIVTDSKGKNVWSWNHDPFGATDPIGQGNFTFDLRFPGQVHDNETGLNYNMMRDYRPDAGRYVESGPLGLIAGINTYGYVGQNPLWAVDRFGLEWQFRNWNNTEWRKWIIYHGWHTEAICHETNANIEQTVSGPDFVDSPPWAVLNMSSAPTYNPYDAMSPADAATILNAIGDLAEATKQAGESGSLRGPESLTPEVGQQLCSTLPLPMCTRIAK